MVLRLLTGIGAAGMALASYIVSTEPIGPSWRGAAGGQRAVQQCWLAGAVLPCWCCAGAALVLAWDGLLL